jgi:hypothetical protein
MSNYISINNDEFESKVRMILINKPLSTYLNLAENFYQNFSLEFLEGNQTYFVYLCETILKMTKILNESFNNDDLVSPLLCELQHSFRSKSQFAKIFKKYQKTIPNDEGRFFGCDALKGFDNQYSIKVQLSNIDKIYEVIERIRDGDIVILRPDIFDAFTGEFTIKEYKICINFHNSCEIPVITIVHRVF